jgi:Questin oxidase-like
VKALSPTLLALLDAGAGHDAEYRGGLSNHGPMALLALHSLGADEARLAAWASTYQRRLQPAPEAAAWPVGDAWTSYLGQRAAWPAYRDLFAQWLEHEGAGDVLGQVLPVLMRGCGAAAFHGLIRTAYAVQAAHRGELADALAYWACRWLDLGPEAAVAAPLLDDPAAALRKLPVPVGPLPGELIFQAMQAVAGQPGFSAAVGALRVDDGTLVRLATGAAELYAASGNFTVLHLLTSAHALRVLLPFIEEPQPALRHYWRAWAAGWAASGAVALPPAPLQPWSRIVSHALSSDDEHAIKLVFSCREQEAALGGRVWRQAASRVLAT